MGSPQEHSDRRGVSGAGWLVGGGNGAKSVRAAPVHSVRATESIQDGACLYPEAGPVERPGTRRRTAARHLLYRVGQVLPC